MQYELLRDGETVPAEPQVLDILAYLVANHYRVVARDELKDAVWGVGCGSEASLAKRIMSARCALGDTGESQSYIRTVRGCGYQFIAVPAAVERLPGSQRRSPMAAQRIAFTQARDGVTLAYGIVGSGPPLVRAANWLTHLGYDADSPVWRHWVSDLAARHRLIRYDERGCGLSDWDVGEFGFEDWIVDLESFVDSLELKRLPLLGVSQGGAVAMAYAARHPERVSRLILLGAYAQGRSVRAVGEAEQRLAELDLDLATLGWGLQEPALRQVFASQIQPAGSLEDWVAFDQLQCRTTTPENAVRFLEQFAAIDVLDQARTVQCPSLVLHSRQDQRVPYRCAQQLRAAIKGSRLVPLASANHLLTADEPAWQVFLDEVDRFLEG